MSQNPPETVIEVASHALFGRESRALAAFRAKWVGLRVMHDGQPATVVGVCDDGHACDGDERRKFKPTGELIIRRDSATTDDYCLPRAVTIPQNAYVEARRARL
jgi:hypothetical protein